MQIFDLSVQWILFCLVLVLQFGKLSHDDGKTYKEKKIWISLLVCFMIVNMTKQCLLSNTIFS